MYGLEQEDIQKITTVFKNHTSIEKAILYGSRAKGNYKPYSDIDLTLVGIDLTQSEQFSIENELDDLLLPYKIDLSIYHKIENQDLTDHIDRVGKVLYKSEKLSEWKEYLLEDVIDTFIDYRGKTPKKSDSGIPLVTAKVVKSGKILAPNEFIPEDEYENWMTRGYPKKNDVVLTTEAPLGEVALIKNENIALAQRIITMRGNPEVLSNVFLKYYLQSDQGQYELDSRASGTTVFGIKASVLRQVPVLLPPLEEQKSIASVLSSLDDKLDLLHRQNQTLEQMAETLFRQCFIEEADEGWEELGLLDIIKLIPGGTPKTKIEEYWNGKIKWISVKEISENYKDFIFESYKTITSKGLNNSSANILPVYGTIISARGTVGKVAMVGEKMAFSQSNFGVLHVSGGLPFFTFLLTQDVVNQLKASAYGSVFDTITTRSFKNIAVKLPELLELERFEELASPYFLKMFNNKAQIRTLTALRDTLLPKLMSGEVRI